MQKTINRVAELTATTFHRIDDEGKLYISPALREWAPVAALGIDSVFDMEGGLDEWIPTTPDGCVYVYFPIYDEELPDMAKLHAVARMAAAIAARN